MPLDDIVVNSITKQELIQKGGKIVHNHENRPMVLFPERARFRKFSKYSYISYIGGRKITKKNSLEVCKQLIGDISQLEYIETVHPTRFCGNCSRPSACFVDYERKGHSTCTGCGVVQHLSQSKFSMRLTDDGVANKSQWEHTPGMTARDCTITTHKGGRLGAKIRSHRRNWWRIKGKIEGIANDWHFSAMESLIKRAKAILKKLYYIIHNDDLHDDNQEKKLPHGGAAIAASCFYCAVLEFEHRVQFKTPCTLPAIQASAQACRDQKSGRKCRDVTDTKILRYARMLQKYNITAVKIPEMGAETLRFHPKSAALQHARMAIFAECSPVKFHLPVSGSWGIKVGDTEQGVLYIERCSIGSSAWDQGLRKGDYIFQLEKETVDIYSTPKKLEQKIINAKQRVQHKSVLELAIMRKKK
jgi:hypothetical protein